ncbi:MAG: SDR family oxidoreductase [Bacteroidia bacterium]|nr:SDR family oxidoreductase [Bacteroidia bacterium]MDW8301384.1 SDR family oxidoreductase [Bacteroidia bacterium]
MSFFQNKVVVVTGASDGIGAALAQELAKKGAYLSICARNEEKLQKIASICQNLGAKKVIALPTDVSNLEQCKNFIQKTIEILGTIHILINNAGISMRACFVDTQISVIEKVMSVNFWGSVYCTKFALPDIIKNQGSIVVVSSVAGFKGLPARTGYSASKFALHGFFESLRCELQPDKVHVLVVCPGFTNTNIRNTALTATGDTQKETPLDESKLMSAEKVAKAIVRGIEKRKRTIVLTTEGKLTVLLNKFFPKFIDKKAYQKLSREPNTPLKPWKG